MNIPIVKLACIVLLLVVFSLFSQIPRQIAYQGVLTDKHGNPRPDSIYVVAFSMYDGESGGNPLWTESDTVTVKKGLFSVLLGGNQRLTLPFDKQYWLGVTIDGDELGPRLKLAGAAYALQADTAAMAKKIPNNIVDSTKIRDNSISGADISKNAKLNVANMEVSGSIKIAGNTALHTGNVIVKTLKYEPSSYWNDSSGTTTEFKVPDFAITLTVPVKGTIIAEMSALVYNNAGGKACYIGPAIDDIFTNGNKGGVRITTWTGTSALNALPVDAGDHTVQVVVSSQALSRSYLAWGTLVVMFFPD